MKNRISSYVRDESIDYMMKSHRTFGKGTVREYIHGKPHDITYDIKKDFREFGQVYITDDLLAEVGSLQQVSLVMIFYILSRLNRDDNRIYLTSGLFCRETGFSAASYYRALAQLEATKWIYKIDNKLYNVNTIRLFKGSIDTLLKKYQIQEKIDQLELDDETLNNINDN